MCIVLVAVVVFRGFSNAYSFWEGLAVLTFSIASVAVFQLIAREMPRTFTVGESIIFSQVSIKSLLFRKEIENKHNTE